MLSREIEQQRIPENSDIDFMKVQGIAKNWGLVKDFVYRDFKTRFAGSVLGVVWNLINPLILIVIYIVIFSNVMRTKLPGVESGYGYSIYLCSGILPWAAFSELLLRYTSLFFEHGGLIKKVSFPKEILHVSALITGTINFLISFSIFIFFLAILHITGRHKVNLTFEQMVIFFGVMGLQQVFCLGLGMAFGVLTVFFRDMGQLVSIFSQLWFWFTPIVYPFVVVPERLKIFFQINPLYHFMNIYRSILYLNQMPPLRSIGIAGGVSLVTFVIGYMIYTKLIEEVPDEL